MNLPPARHFPTGKGGADRRPTGADRRVRGGNDKRQCYHLVWHICITSYNVNNIMIRMYGGVFLLPIIPVLVDMRLLVLIDVLANDVVPVPLPIALLVAMHRACHGHEGRGVPPPPPR